MNIYGWSLTRNAVHWYRVQEPLRGLRLLGHETKIGTELNDEIFNWADILMTSVHGQEEASRGWQLISEMPNRPTMVYDIDDDVWNFDPSLAQYEYWKDDATLLRVQNDIAVSDIVTTPSKVLAHYLQDLNRNIVVLPNTVPAHLLKIPPKYPPIFTVGYQGGDTHKHDTDMILADLFKFIARSPNRRLHVWGAPGYDGPFTDRVTVTPWQKSVQRYYVSLTMSVGLAPLTQTPFNDCKSGIKALEYSALGYPAIVSDCPAYDEWVVDGVTGRRVPYGADWCEVLEELAVQPLAWRTMGEKAREFAAEWTTEVRAVDWERAYTNAQP